MQSTAFLLFFFKVCLLCVKWEQYFWSYCERYFQLLYALAWTSRKDGQETPKNGKNYWGLMRFFWCCDKTVRDNFKILFGYWEATISADNWTKEILKSHKRGPHGPLAPQKSHLPKIGLFIPKLKISKSIWCWCQIICFLGQQIQ